MMMNFDILNFQKNAFILVVSFICGTLSFGCTLLAPPPNHIEAVPLLDKTGNVVFEYKKNILTQSYFARDNYIVTGVELVEHSCIGKDCYPKIWEVSLPEDFNKKSIDFTLLFPEKILYGKEMDGFSEKIPSATLKTNVPYHIIIGINGFDNGNKNDVYFSANAYFMLKLSSVDGKKKLLVWGRNGEKFDLSARKF